MQEIITFFENLITPLIDWWYAGGKETAIAFLSSAPVVAVAGYILRLWFIKRKNKLLQQRELIEADTAQKRKAVNDMTATVNKELTKHGKH